MTPRRRRPAAAIWRFRGGLERVDHRCALTAVDRDDGGSLLSASPANMYKLMQSKRGRNGERSVLWSATVALTSWQVMLFPKTSWTLSRSEAVKSLGSSPLQLHSILDKH
uniref:Uncharacterized protein n=1 Tax=Oryza glumipatula TaxID=40148 RepID=A0A0D9ZC18_9ORYZ